MCFLFKFLLILYKLYFPEVRDSTDVFDGANGDSAQRCKARFERHQRIGERVVWFLVLPNISCTN